MGNFLFVKYVSPAIGHPEDPRLGRLPTVLLHSMWTPSRAVSITASLELRLDKSWPL